MEQCSSLSIHCSDTKKSLLHRKILCKSFKYESTIRNIRRNEYGVKVVGVLSNRKVQCGCSIEIVMGHCCPHRETPKPSKKPT